MGEINIGVEGQKENVEDFNDQIKALVEHEAKVKNVMLKKFESKIFELKNEDK